MRGNLTTSSFTLVTRPSRLCHQRPYHTRIQITRLQNTCSHNKLHPISSRLPIPIPNAAHPTHPARPDPQPLPPRSPPRRAQTETMSKIDRIIARLQKRITEGQPEEQYEAQQETRLVAARYTKAENWGAAIDILSSVSQALLKAGQGGSGGDLAILLVDVYRQAAQKPDTTAKGRLLTCLRLFDSEEPTRKKFIKVMIEYVSLSAGVGCIGVGTDCLRKLQLV